MSNNTNPTTPATIVLRGGTLLHVDRFARFEVDEGTLLAFAVDADGDFAPAALVAPGQWTALYTTNYAREA